MWGKNSAVEAVAEQPSDVELWRRGDRDSFGALFQRHADAVWNFAYRLTGSWASAEDLTAETFTTAWAKRKRVALELDSAQPWLFAVTMNLARKEHRRTTRFAAARRRLPPTRDEPDHADEVNHRFDQEPRIRQVLAAIDALTPAEREAAQLCLLGELTTAEAATALGLAESSVRARLSRARAHLRTHLGDLHA